jgi:hypothetical protein
VDFVDIGQRVVLVGQVADRVDRGDVAVHRIDAFERDQLGHFGIGFGQQFFQMRDVVVTPHTLFAARIADAGDHRGVVEFVRKDDAARQDLGQRRQRRVVRDIARW